MRPAPSAGNSLISCASSKTATSPSQNTGNEMPSSPTTMVATSTKLPARRAAVMPSGTPSTTAMNRPLAASAAELGRLSRISSSAGCPVTTDLPRSPVTARATKRPNWTGSG